MQDQNRQRSTTSSLMYLYIFVCIDVCILYFLSAFMLLKNVQYEKQCPAIPIFINNGTCSRLILRRYVCIYMLAIASQKTRPNWLKFFFKNTFFFEKIPIFFFKIFFSKLVSFFTANAGHFTFIYFCVVIFQNLRLTVQNFILK